MNRRFISMCLFFFLFMLMLTGCADAQMKTYVPRLVIKIDIDACQENTVYTQSVTDSKRMSVVLNYLRMLDAYTVVPIESETFRADVFRITVHFSDGSQKIYHQLYNQYLQVDNSNWKKIDPKHGSRLSEIINSLYSSA